MKIRARKQRVSIFARNPCAFRLEVELPVDPVGLNVPDVGLAGIEDHSLPVILEKKKSCVALLIILDAKLDKRLFLDRNLADQILNKPILVPLRENLESDFPEVGIRRHCGDLPGHLLSEHHEGCFELSSGPASSFWSTVRFQFVITRRIFFLIDFLLIIF